MSASTSVDSEHDAHATRTSTSHDQPTHELQPTADAIDYLKAYARERPEVAALWCFGIGFILGWKLKPW